MIPAPPPRSQRLNLGCEPSWQSPLPMRCLTGPLILFFVDTIFEGLVKILTRGIGVVFPTGAPITAAVLFVTWGTHLHDRLPSFQSALPGCFHVLLGRDFHVAIVLSCLVPLTPDSFSFSVLLFRGIYGFCFLGTCEPSGRHFFLESS